MKHLRVLFVLAIALTLGGCSLFGGDDSDQDLSTSELVTPEPTANVVQAVPAEETADPTAADEAVAPLPTAVTLPATPVPPEPTVDRSQPTTYIVQTGDVLGLIAEQFDVDIADLRRINGLSGNLIRVGQELTIPAADGTDVAATPTTSPTSAPTSAGPTSVPVPVSCGSGASGYCVQPGDSLLGIASQHGVTVDEIRAANPSISGDFIRSGDLLTIPGASTSPTVDVVPGTTVDPVVGPASDADCAALNPDFPYYHAADQLCYANPIGGATAVPTSEGAEPDVECPTGTFLWEDGLCYPIPGTTVTVEPSTTGTTTVQFHDYGITPCRIGYETAPNGRCLPGPNVTATTVTPVPTT